VVPSEEYTDALSRELSIRFAESDSATIDTLYFGGGTPSRLGALGVQRAIAAVRERFTLPTDAELTLEANPEDITADNVAAWRDAGVNRLSIGGQSFDDNVLQWMHRTHDAAAIERAFATARRGGIDNISLDLIFALPESLERVWERDVMRALDLVPDHVSLYGLTVEPHTPLGRGHARGEVAEAPEERYEREFLFAHDALASAGFDHYEVSNFGRAGRHSRHNQAYWNDAPYAGLGPSAHEFDGTSRRWNAKAYTDWLRALAAGRDPVEAHEALTPENRIAEHVYLGLRTTSGVVISEGERQRVQPWIDAGWAVVDNTSRLRLTPLGWLRLDALAADLTLVRSRY
jgi:oxygen-independent coproporphyrinogen-3 oxidase